MIHPDMRDRRVLLASITLIWTIAWAIALLGYHVQWHTLPEFDDTLMSTTLLAPLALPISFGTTCGALLAKSKLAATILGVAYWPCVLLTQGLCLYRRSWRWLLVLAPPVWISAWFWFVVGTGMMGI